VIKKINRLTALIIIIIIILGINAEWESGSNQLSQVYLELLNSWNGVHARGCDWPEAVWTRPDKRRPHTTTGVAAAVAWYICKLGFNQRCTAVIAVVILAWSCQWRWCCWRQLRSQHGTEVQSLLWWILRLSQQTAHIIIHWWRWGWIYKDVLSSARTSICVRTATGYLHLTASLFSKISYFVIFQ